LKGVSRVSLDILERGKRASRRQKKTCFKKNEEYLTYLVNMDQSELLPGVLNATLKKKKPTDSFGISQQNARPILEKTGIRHYFDAIVDGNDVTNAKPDPKYS
jgi:beta-phosphoglucomutase